MADSEFDNLEYQRAEPSGPAEAHFREAWQARKDKRFEDAIVAFKESLKHEPDHPATHFNLGLVYDQVGQGGPAVYHLTHARDLFLIKSDGRNQAGAQRTLNRFYKKYPETDPDQTASGGDGTDSNGKV